MNKNLNAPAIETNRLYIRFVDLVDANAYYKMCSNYNVCKYLTFNPYQNIFVVKKVINNMIRAYLQGSDLNYSILLKDKKIVIGSISLSFKNNNVADVGYLLDFDYWNNGYMDEALKAIIKLSREYFKLEYLTASYLKENYSSAKLLEKNSFKTIEIIKNGFIKNNFKYDLVKCVLKL